MRRKRLVVEDLGFPHQPARRGLEGKDVVVDTGIDDEVVVDGDIPVDLDENGDEELVYVLYGSTSSARPTWTA